MSSFTYWQLTWGGLFGAHTANDPIHLARGATQGPTLCGITRFQPDSPAGTWIQEPSAVVCGACVEAERLRPEEATDETPRDLLDRSRLLVESNKDQLRIAALSLHDENIGLRAALAELRAYNERKP